MCSLQVNLQLNIFSYLDARSLCTAASTCHYWNMLSEDKVLWMNLLQRDMHKWSTMGYQSCPSTYMEARSDLSLKQMWVRQYASQSSIIFVASSLINKIWFDGKTGWIQSKLIHSLSCVPAEPEDVKFGNSFIS